MNYILEGKIPKPCDNLDMWAECFGANRHVGDTEISKAVRVSTVFLGIDHSYGINNVPILFETMIFGGKHDEYCERYTTWDEAEKGHKKAVKLAKK